MTDLHDMNDQMHTMYRHNPDFVSRQIASEMILVPIRNRIADMDYIYTLNDTAARIWQLIDGQCSLPDVQAQICQEFDIEPQAVQKDMTDLVKEMVEIGALVRA